MTAWTKCGLPISNLEGKGGMSYKEKQEAELAAKEESLSAAEGFKGKDGPRENGEQKNTKKTSNPN